MAYSSKNPKFNSAILKDQTTDSVDNPASGSHKLLNRNGSFLVKDSSGNETPLGASGGGGINLVINPDGDTALDGSRTNDIGDWIDYGSGTTSTRTTSAAEIPLSPNKDNAIKIALSSGTSDYTGLRFEVPASARNKKLGLSWFQLCSSYTASTMGVELYSYSDTYVTPTEVIINGADSSGDTFIANYNGLITHSFDADDRQYYELRFTNVGATTGFVAFNDVKVSPDKVAVPGAVLTEWAAFTPSFVSSLGISTGGNYVAPNGMWRRNGTNMDIRMSFRNGTVDASGGSVDIALTIPDSKTADSASLVSSAGGIGGFDLDGFAFFKDDGTAANTKIFNAVIDRTGLTSIKIINSPAATYLKAQDIDADDSLDINVSVPISQWAGSGTVNIGNNGVEYAYNTGTWDSNDTTSFAYGPAGRITGGTLTATRTKRVRFLTPIQPTDKVELQVSSDSGVTWVSPGYGSIATFHSQNTTEYGAGVAPIDSNSTDVDAVFGQYRITNGTTFASAGANWPSTFYWRVVKYKAGRAVGFGNATSTEDGLVKKGKWQTKTVSSAVQTDTAFLTFNNLVVGETYELIARLSMTNNATDTAVRASIQHNSTVLDVTNYQRISAPGAGISAQTLHAVFVAGATTVTLNSNSASANAFIRADDTSASGDGRSFATLIARRDLGSATTDFN